MSPTIKAWLSIGSTYTYLTALRLRSVVDASGIKLDIRPISIRQIMKNMDNIPFPPSKKTKVDYMWRDIQRRSEFYSLPVPNVQAPYPLKEFDRANLVGILYILCYTTSTGWRPLLNRQSRRCPSVSTSGPSIPPSYLQNLILFSIKKPLCKSLSFRRNFSSIG